MWDISGVHLDVEEPPGQAARVIRLIADHIRSFGGEPFVRIPCGDARYIRWATEAGIPWVAQSGDFVGRAISPAARTTGCGGRLATRVVLQAMERRLMADGLGLGIPGGDSCGRERECWTDADHA